MAEGQRAAGGSGPVASWPAWRAVGVGELGERDMCSATRIKYLISNRYRPFGRAPLGAPLGGSRAPHPVCGLRIYRMVCKIAYLSLPGTP